jgi:phosphatidate phosphatase PAH1
MKYMPFALALCACSTTSSPPVTVDPGESADAPSGKADSAFAIPDVHCSGEPDAGPAGDFRHFSSELIAAAGDPLHRGFDVVAPASADPQVISGWTSYSIIDKALEDEDVDVFACRASQWKKIGRARTDDEGHFTLTLSGSARLPIGMRDLYLSVVGDRSGAGFLAYVAPDGAPLVASDVDGTLTASENAFLESLALGGTPGEQAGASDAFQRIVTAGYPIVYVTARGNRYTADTRQWLADLGFPRGPVRLADAFVTLPGQDTIDYKTTTLQALGDGLTLFAGIGNRDTDITAYTTAGVSADHIFIKLPEYIDEVKADLAAGKAIGFSDYVSLRL